MLEMVRQVGVENPSTFLVPPDNVVNPLNRYTRLSLAFSDTDNSLRRPMSLEALLDILPILF